MSSGNSIGLMVPKGWYTRSQAAKMVGRSVKTLRRWEVDTHYPVGPSGIMTLGRVDIGLYSDKDIEWLRWKAAATKRGVTTNPALAEPPRGRK